MKTMRSQPQAEKELKRFFRQFVSDRSGRRRARNALLKRLSNIDGDLVVFGGALRDLVSRKSGYVDVNDVDIVYRNVNEEELLEALSEHCRIGRNKFGGIKAESDGHFFDLWRFEDTWAFRNGHFSESDIQLRNLVHTTQLTIESVMVHLRVGSNTGREVVVTSEFVNAINTKTVEIAFEPNPDPIAAVVRAIVIADRLHFSCGPKLVNYIYKIVSTAPRREFRDFYDRRYGEQTLFEWKTVDEQLSRLISHFETYGPSAVMLRS